MNHATRSGQTATVIHTHSALAPIRDRLKIPYTKRNPDFHTYSSSPTSVIT